MYDYLLLLLLSTIGNGTIKILCRSGIQKLILNNISQSAACNPFLFF